MVIQSIEGYGQGNFSEIVAREYKRFLLVKAIEYIAGKKNDGDPRHPTLVIWQEKCQATKLIDVFWHTHMLSPRKYLQDCMSLVGDIIDHDAGYVSPDKQKGSDYASKKKQAAIYEYKHLRRGSLHYPNRLLFDNTNVTIHQVAQGLVDEMNCLDDCG